jgi:hypothetical protein
MPSKAEIEAMANNLLRHIAWSEKNAITLPTLCSEVVQFYEEALELRETDFMPGLRRIETQPLPPTIIDLSKLKDVHTRNGIMFVGEALLRNRPQGPKDLEQWALSLRGCPEGDPKQAAIRLLRLICAWMDVHGESWLQVFGRTVGDDSAINVRVELDPQELSGEIMKALAPIALDAMQTIDQTMAAGLNTAHAPLTGGEGL